MRRTSNFIDWLIYVAVRRTRLHRPGSARLIRKSVKRFSEKIMSKQGAKARWWWFRL